MTDLTLPTGSRRAPNFLFFDKVLEIDGRPLTRGRGLKHVNVLIEPCVGRRPLTRGRGLKLPLSSAAMAIVRSPAHTRAWIETRRLMAWCAQFAVARSHAGVD